MKNKIIVGASSMAGMYDAIGEDEAIAMVHRALAAGFDKFDTAPHYGLGIGEERLGKALRGQPRNVKVWTKVGRVICGRSAPVFEESNVAGNSIFAETPENRVPVRDYSAEGVAKSLSDSLNRLGRESVFGARVHDPDTVPLSAFEALRQFDLEVSIGTNDPDIAMGSLDSVDAVMLANCWNLVDQDGAEVLAECSRKRIPVHLGGIFASGLLAGKNYYKYDDAVPGDVSRKLEAWRVFARNEGFDLKLLALAFAFLPNAVDLVAIGLRTADEVDDTCSLLE